jgi:MFS family permease
VYGRRITLLLSILLITLPTVLIGCLPSYEMIGIAAPVLLAVFRFVQGAACCLLPSYLDYEETWCDVVLCMIGIALPVLLAMFRCRSYLRRWVGTTGGIKFDLL